MNKLSRLIVDSMLVLLFLVLLILPMSSIALTGYRSSVQVLGTTSSDEGTPVERGLRDEENEKVIIYDPEFSSETLESTQSSEENILLP
jgi:hypothetical protein